MLYYRILLIYTSYICLFICEIYKPICTLPHHKHNHVAYSNKYNKNNTIKYMFPDNYFSKIFTSKTELIKTIINEQKFTNIKCN